MGTMRGGRKSVGLPLREKAKARLLVDVAAGALSLR
jgi:hypothetical protein